MGSAIGKDPPKEFRIFAKGWNYTAKGNVLFDDQAAKTVIAGREQAGVRCMVDLEHLSLDDEAPNYDPDSRAWFDVELRNGELWAVNLEWTPDGDHRIRSGKQRYISPAFAFNKKTKRVEALYNVAICAIPATYDAPALVAASIKMAASMRAGQTFGTLSTEIKKMDELKKIAAALGLGDDATAEDCIGAIKAMSDGGGDSDETMKKLRKLLKLADDASEDDVDQAMKKLDARGGYEHINDDGDGGKLGETMKKLRKLLKLADDASEDDVDQAMKKLDARGGYEHINDDGDGGKLGVETDSDDDKPVKKPKTEDEKAEAKLALSNPRLYGELMALRSNSKEFNKRLGRLEAVTEQSAVDRLIQKNIKKLTLKQEKWARSQSIQVLSGFFENAQDVRKEESVEPGRETAESGVAKLSKEDLEMCKRSGIAPKIVLEQRKNEIAEKARRRGLSVA